MEVEDIVKSVRFCIDEAPSNDANFEGAADGDASGMDDIIKDKIPDALRWVCMFASPQMLTGTDTTGTGTGIIYEGQGISTETGTITMPQNFIKLCRIRGSQWHRAITGETLIREDSEDYLKLYDDYAAATNERPQAAIIEKEIKEIQVFPSAENTFDYTCIVMPTAVHVGNDNNIPLPPMAKTAFIYYLAFILLSAYNDARATRMLDIAKMNIGIDEKNNV